jgi:hypothetical protein
MLCSQANTFIEGGRLSKGPVVLALATHSSWRSQRNGDALRNRLRSGGLLNCQIKCRNCRVVCARPDFAGTGVAAPPTVRTHTQGKTL